MQSLDHVTGGVWGGDPLSYCYFNGDELGKFVFLLQWKKQNNKYYSVAAQDEIPNGN